MYDHVTIRVSDRAASERFFLTVLPVIDVEQDNSEDWIAEWGEFSISPADAEHPPTRGLHIGFAAPSREHVDAFWRAGVDAGYRDDGQPGLRPEYGPDYYGGFLLDPDGNSVEAVHHDNLRGAVIDHLWIRVGDFAATKRFYEALAPHAGLRVGHQESRHIQFLGERASTSFREEAPRTQHVHLAFPAADDGRVDAFHRAMVAEGYRDNGAPGERPEYHPGYYGAFVLDPDGNNVELVHHNR